MTHVAVVLTPVSLPAWGWMWLLAGTIFAAAKWLTWRGVSMQMGRTGTLIYWLGWPGLDAAPFARGARHSEVAPWTDWVFALSKLTLGVVLVGIAAAEIDSGRALSGGAIGFAGLLFCLHFGLFHLLALVWSAAGYRVEPIMQAPCRARSLAEFWGRRWNRAFTDMSQQLIVRPGRTLLGRRGMLLAVFGVSGLLHESVISLPAGGGYGGPTAYFLIQAIGISLQRTSSGRGYGLDHGWKGWLCTALFVLGPLPLLFHPPFLVNVIAPFVNVLVSR